MGQLLFELLNLPLVIRDDIAHAMLDAIKLDLGYIPASGIYHGLV